MKLRKEEHSRKKQATKVSQEYMKKYRLIRPKKRTPQSPGGKLKCWFGFHEWIEWVQERSEMIPCGVFGWTKRDSSKRRYCKRCGEAEYYACHGFLFENPVMESGHCGWHPLTERLLLLEEGNLMEAANLKEQELLAKLGGEGK